MDQRVSGRVQKSFAVSVMSEDFGHSYAIARNISCGGMMVEVPKALPLGTPVYVKFSIPEAHSDVVMRGEVKHLYVINLDPQAQGGAFIGMGIRFTAFEKRAKQVLGAYLPGASQMN